MRCTYILFEGVFRKEQSAARAKRLYSSMMIPTDNKVEAHLVLRAELNEDEIDLLAIEDEFIIDPDGVDFSDPDNALWVSLYEETQRFNKPIKTPWQIFYE
jgi:hypothetical protein